MRPGKAALLWACALWAICEKSRVTFSCCFLVYVQPPFWLCDRASFSQQIVKKKKNLFQVCGKADMGWDQALEIWEPDIKSALFLFHAPAPAESLCYWLLAKSWLLPFLRTALVWRSQRCLPGEEISPPEPSLNLGCWVFIVRVYARSFGGGLKLPRVPFRCWWKPLGSPCVKDPRLYFEGLRQ